MFGALLGLGIASALVGGVASGYNSYKQSTVQQNNLELQREQFEYQKSYDVWQKDLAERNYQLQSRPISSLVADGQNVGVNPMAAMGQNVGSVSIPSSGASASPVGLQDTGLSSMMSMLGNIISRMVIEENEFLG